MSRKTLYLGKVRGLDQNGKINTWYINKNKFHSESFESVKHGATTDRDLLKEHCLSLIKFYDNSEYSDLGWSIATFTTDVDYENNDNKMENNNVNHPKHYNQYPKEAIDIIIDTFGVEQTIVWCTITAFKYRLRMGLKGNLQEDFDKEQWYLNKAEELKKQLTVLSKDPLYDKHCEEEKQTYTLFSDIKEYVICDLEYKLLFTGTFAECGEYKRNMFKNDRTKTYFLDGEYYISCIADKNTVSPKSDIQETRTDKGCLINPDVIVNPVTGEEFRWKGASDGTSTEDNGERQMWLNSEGNHYAVRLNNLPSYITKEIIWWHYTNSSFEKAMYERNRKQMTFYGEDEGNRNRIGTIENLELDLELLKPKSE